MTTTEAIALARTDLESIRHANLTATADAGLLVDGTAFSPSWRRLDGGARVWDAYDEHYDDRDAFFALQDAYVETLDAGTDAIGAFWEDGCLWASVAAVETD